MAAARLAIPPLSRNGVTNPAALFLQLRTILDAVEIQLNQNPLVSSRTDNKTDQGLQRGDPVFRLSNGVLKVGMYTGKTTQFLSLTDLQGLQNPNPNTQFKGMVADTTAVGSAGTLAHFPNINDWGFYNRTSTSVLYFVYNYTGIVLKSVILA